MSKFIHNFDTYYGSPNEVGPSVRVHHGESTAARDVVVGLLAQGLASKGHHITMDSFFTSVCLFIELARIQIYASDTVCSKCVRLPLSLRNLCSFRRSPHGHLEWRMHVRCCISCVMWKDKCPILLLSTHAHYKKTRFNVTSRFGHVDVGADVQACQR